MYVSRTEMLCSPPQSGQRTFSVSDHAARNVSKSVSMPAGACCLVFGQVNSSGPMAVFPPSVETGAIALIAPKTAAAASLVIDDASLEGSITFNVGSFDAGGFVL